MLPSVYVRRELVGVAHSHNCLLLLGIFTNFVVLPPDLPGATFPTDLRAPTLELASSHLICSVALTGVLALQTGKWWVERADDDANAAAKLSTVARGSNAAGKESGEPEAKVAPMEKDLVAASAPSST